jgi:hypothetical protein
MQPAFVLKTTMKRLPAQSTFTRPSSARCPLADAGRFSAVRSRLFSWTCTGHDGNSLSLNPSGSDRRPQTRLANISLLFPNPIQNLETATITAAIITALGQIAARVS